MELSNTQLVVGIGGVIIAQFTQTAIMMFKGISKANILETNQKNIIERIDRQNGRIEKLEDQDQHHIEQFHTGKK